MVTVAVPLESASVWKDKSPVVESIVDSTAIPAG
jgi:hypothetical protein